MKGGGRLADKYGRIHKSKYDERDEDERGGRTKEKERGSEKKPRDKSRTRTLFGRKKTAAA